MFIFSQSTPCRLLLGGLVADGQLTEAFHGSSNACDYVSVGDCARICDCRILMTQPCNVILQEVCCYEHLVVHILYHNQGLLI